MANLRDVAKKWWCSSSVDELKMKLGAVGWQLEGKLGASIMKCRAAEYPKAIEYPVGTSMTFITTGRASIVVEQNMLLEAALDVIPLLPRVRIQTPDGEHVSIGPVTSYNKRTNTVILHYKEPRVREIFWVAKDEKGAKCCKVMSYERVE